ncbi:MAG: hypothetical protein NG740_00800 [Omnitrophica bacterium]|nr:hypothetical protein [Candidatus Omnitrophota bacterium]
MREIIFKNLNTPRANKRDISMEEIVERDGVVSSTKKRSMYFVREVHHMKTHDALQKWVANRQKSPGLGKKFFHILHKYSTKDHEDKLVCKMRGSFCIISDKDVYDIVFVHAIKICIHKTE